MTFDKEKTDLNNKSILTTSQGNTINAENKSEKKKSSIRDIRSIKPFRKHSDEFSSDDERDDIADITCMPDISTVKRKEDKIYQHLLPIENGFYDGTVSENFLREGLGTYSINNGEEYYSGSWKTDKFHGYGYHFQHHGSTIYHGEFHYGTLKEGYGKVKLDHEYEYKGTISDGKFHGLGILSIKIAGLKDMDNTSIEKDTLQIVAEWNMSKTHIVYRNEIQQYYTYQYKVFCNSLESILLLDNESLRKQRQYFQTLIGLLDKRLLNLNLLREIGGDSLLPRELTSSANLLYALDNSYTNLKIYTEIDIQKSYNDCVKNACQVGLQSYARRLAKTEDDDKIDYIFAKEIFDEKLNSFTKKSKLGDLQQVLSFSTLVIDLIKKLVSFANERLIRVSSQYRSEFINSHTKLIKTIWIDYLKLIEDKDNANILEYENDEKYNFYVACYLNLLQLSFINPSEIEVKLIADRKSNLVEEDKPKNEIELIIYEAMIFSLKNLKPWRDFDMNILSSYFQNEYNIHQDSSMKEIGDKLLLKILKDTKAKMMRFFKRNTNYLSGIFESIIVYYQNNLLNITNSNYQSNMQEIIKMNDYFLKISETNDSHIQDILIDLQLELIRKCIKNQGSLSDYIDHFLNFNTELCKLSQDFSTFFPIKIDPIKIDTGFNNIALQIISSIEDIFKIIFETDRNIINRPEILEKYRVPDLSLEAALRQAVCSRLVDDVVILLELGANVNEPGPDSGKTALHWAIIRENTQLISLLLENGADIEIKDNTGNSPRDYASSNIDLDSLLAEIYNKNREESSKLKSQLYALQKINNFLKNLSSLDFTWVVEHKKISKFDNSLFKPAGGKGLYLVTNIEKAKTKVSAPYHHYMLEIIKGLLDIIKNIKFTARLTSHEIIRIRAELIMAIGKSLKYLYDQVKYSSLERFKNECIIPFEDVIKEIESYEEFYNKLEKIESYFLYDRKLKEITLDQALETFQKKNGNLSRCDLIKKAFLNYEKCFKKYFYDIIDRKHSIENVIHETKKIAIESNLDKKQIPKIIAGLSVIFSLRVSNFIEKNSKGEYVLKDKYNKRYFLQPHCIQILGLFLLLNINDESNAFPPNHLAEIVTGQGKSWALALLAGYFSLIGYQVTVSCYSDYLSERDEKDFQKYLDPFNFNNSVKYRTFKSMCEEQLKIKNQKKNLRSIISDILTGEHLSPEHSKENHKQKSLLLIDEVDVFFSNEFGTMYSPGLRIENKSLGEIQKDIWKNLMTGKNDKNQIQILAEQTLLKSSNQDQVLSQLFKSNILKDHLKRMIDTAIRIYEDMKNKNELRERYKIIDDIIHTKDDYGKFVSTTWYDYENSFYYLKLMYEKQNSFNGIILNKKNFGYLSIRCGLLSYSELPNSYNGIFGVSGSLQCLSAGEQSLLTYYNIHQRSYYPSFFGGSVLRFNVNNDFIIKESKKDWFEKITIHARRNILKNRSVLIFFYDEKPLDEFFDFYSGDLGVVPFYVTQNKISDGQKLSKIDFNELIKDEYAGHDGKVTLLTREFGRGVDFQAEAKVNENGGIHVIQTFFSENIKEEIQIKGRTARKDNPGSYELILCLEHLQKPELTGMTTPKFLKVTKDTTYDELDRQRTEIVDLFCQEKIRQIRENSARHKSTLSFFQLAISECNDTNRSEFIKQIMQLD